MASGRRDLKKFGCEVDPNDVVPATGQRPRDAALATPEVEDALPFDPPNQLEQAGGDEVVLRRCDPSPYHDANAS